VADHWPSFSNLIDPSEAAAPGRLVFSPGGAENGAEIPVGEEVAVSSTPSILNLKVSSKKAFESASNPEIAIRERMKSAARRWPDVIDIGRGMRVGTALDTNRASPTQPFGRVIVSVMTRWGMWAARER
jgi:hypothetical protein